MIVGPPRIAALCALSVGMLLLATGGPSVTSGSPAAQETFTGSTEPVVAPTPPGLPLGGVLLRDVRIGAHESFDRITFEFDGGLPGYKVQYVEPPIRLDGHVAAIEGSAFIQIVMQQAAAHDLRCRRVRPAGPGRRCNTRAWSLPWFAAHNSSLVKRWQSL